MVLVCQEQDRSVENGSVLSRPHRQQKLNEFDANECFASAWRTLDDADPMGQSVQNSIELTPV